MSNTYCHSCRKLEALISRYALTRVVGWMLGEGGEGQHAKTRQCSRRFRPFFIRLQHFSRLKHLNLCFDGRELVSICLGLMVGRGSSTKRRRSGSTFGRGALPC